MQGMISRETSADMGEMAVSNSGTVHFGIRFAAPVPGCEAGRPIGTGPFQDDPADPWLEH